MSLLDARIPVLFLFRTSRTLRLENLDGLSTLFDASLAMREES